MKSIKIEFEFDQAHPNFPTLCAMIEMLFLALDPKNGQDAVNAFREDVMSRCGHEKIFINEQRRTNGQ